MLASPRDIFRAYLYEHYDPIPPRSKAPEVGEAIGQATWPRIASAQDILRDVWLLQCHRLAAEFLKDPDDENDDLQSAFNFYNTPKDEQQLLTNIGHRRMRSPEDGAMVDLVNPRETSSQELWQLADGLKIYGEQCLERARYIRELAKLRKNRGY